MASLEKSSLLFRLLRDFSEIPERDQRVIASYHGRNYKNINLFMGINFRI